MNNYNGNMSSNRQGNSQSRNSSGIRESQFSNQNGVPTTATQSGTASASSASFNRAQNPHMTRLFQIPASQPLEDNSDSVICLGEKGPKRPRTPYIAARQTVPVFPVDKDVVANSALSPASTLSCGPSPERNSPGYSNSSPMSTFSQSAPCSTPAPLASPVSVSSPSTMQGRAIGQNVLAMSPPATIPPSQFVHPERIGGRASASGQNRTSSTLAQPSVAPGIRHDQRPSMAKHTQDHSGQSCSAAAPAAQGYVRPRNSGQPRRARSPSLLSGINQIAQGGRHHPGHDRAPSQTVHKQTTETAISRPQQEHITLSSQQSPPTEPALGGTKRKFPDGSNSSADPPAKKRVQFQTLSPASGSADNPPSVASSSRGSALVSSGSTRSPTHLAPAGEVLRQTGSHTSQPKSVQSTAAAVASTSKRSHGSSSKSSHSSSTELDWDTVLNKATSAYRKQLEGRLKRNFSRRPQEGLQYIKKFGDRVSPEHSGLFHLLSLYGHIDRGNYKHCIQKMWEELQRAESESSNERQLATMEKQLKELEGKLKDFRKKHHKNEDQWTRAEWNLYKPIAKEYTELYQRYVNESGSGCAGRNAAHKHLLEPIDLSQATEFPKINLLVEEYVNASKIEFKNGLAVSVDEIHSPYFKDIKEIVEQAAQEFNNNLRKDSVDKLARNIYTVVVRQNQAGRSMDSAREIYNHADLTDQETRERALRKDPALGSPDLQHELEKNDLLGEMNMDTVMAGAVFRALSEFNLDNDIDSIHTEFSERDNDFSEDEDIEDLIDRPNEVPETQCVPEAPEGFYDDDTLAVPMETAACSPANGASYHTETNIRLNPNRRFFQ